MSKNESGDSGKLTGRQQRAVVALLTTRSTRDAARAAKIGEATLHRWLKVPEFVAAYEAARRQVVELTIGRVAHASTAALDTLLEVMTNPEAPASPRVTAALGVLSITAKAMELAKVTATAVQGQSITVEFGGAPPPEEITNDAGPSHNQD